MNRDEFLKRFSNPKTARKYDVIFRKFDSFLYERNQTEDQFILALEKAEKHDKYNILQEMVFYFGRTLSPRSTRNYFDSIFKYLLYAGCDLDHTQRKVRVQFVRVIQKIPQGLDLERIKILLGFADSKLGLLMRVLGGGGFREAEALQLKPKYFSFEETALDLPTRITVVPDIAKFGIGRETFLPPRTSLDLKSYIRANMIGPDDYIFIKKFDENTVSNFDHIFDKIRKKAGLETEQTIKYQHNDISLHSFRAWFITTWDQLGKKSFGHALAGHSKDLSVYFRTSPDVRLRQYKEFQEMFSF